MIERLQFWAPGCRILVVLTAVLALHPSALTAQQKTNALLGAGLGTLAGAYVSTAVVVTNARLGHYRFSPDEISWELIPMPAIALTGGVVGYQDGTRLWQGVLWGSVGFVGGTGAGALLGRLAWGPGAGQWAGGVIGGAVGILAGGAIGIIRSEGGADGSAPAQMSFAVPSPW